MALVRAFGQASPRFGNDVWLADTATVIGDVECGDECNIWYGCVLRGDVGKIRLGQGVNVQDLSCIHMTTDVSDAILEDEASIGHGVIIHGAIIGAGALVGMGAVLLDNAVVGEEALIGAGSLVTSGTKIPPRTLAVGRPAKVVRELSADEARAGRKTARKYRLLAEQHEQSRRA